MIAKEHRFHGQRSLSFAYRQGTTVRNQSMAIKFVLNRRRQTYRAAVIVSKKVHKSAVTRNRIRRRLYEIVHEHEDAINEPYDIILTVFSEQLAEMPAPKLTAMVAELLVRARILRPSRKLAKPAHDIVKPKEDR